MRYRPKIWLKFSVIFQPYSVKRNFFCQGGLDLKPEINSSDLHVFMRCNLLLLRLSVSYYENIHSPSHPHPVCVFFGLCVCDLIIDL